MNSVFLWYNIIMKEGTKKYFRAIAMMIGMAVGVGLFGVPYVLSKSGTLAGLIYFVILGVAVAIIHLIYGESILRTKGNHRLGGLAEIYLGKKWKAVAIIFSTAGFYAVIVAYIILGGEFLKNLLSPFLGGELIFYQAIFWAVMSAVILVGLRTVVFSELILTAVLIITMLGLMVVIWSRADFLNFSALGTKDYFLPYGVILFSIAAASAVPEVLEILNKEKKRAKGAILWGSIFSILLVALFSFAVLGATGATTSKDAVSGLSAIFGPWMLYAGSFFGLFAVATSFLPLSLYAKEQFNLDLKFNGYLSWALACVVPFLIFVFGTRDFIRVISFTGAVFSGFESFLLIWIYRRAKKTGARIPEYSLNLPFAVLTAVGVMFILGMIYEIRTFF